MFQGLCQQSPQFYVLCHNGQTHLELPSLGVEGMMVQRRGNPLVPRREPMITVRVTADIKDDRRVVLTLPPEVPVGRSELIVSVADQPQPVMKQLRSDLAEWAEEHAEHWGNRLSAADVEGFTGRGA